MTCFVYRSGKLVPKETAPPREGRGPSVISDSMDALIHPMTGKMMDSKSRFRAVTRAKGGVEVGNEKLVDRRSTVGLDSGTRRADIRQAMRELGFNGGN